jgi:SAM-dependent methyltransferase
VPSRDMAESTDRLTREREYGPWKLLSLPRVYSRFQSWLAVPGALAQVAQYVGAQRGDAVLDIGCGPAAILTHLPDVEYLGVDLNARYLEHARRRYAARPGAVFLQQDVRRLPSEWAARFDLVLAFAVLHHFSDDQVLELLSTVRAFMKRDARLVTFDPAYVPSQPLVARMLAASDRGRFVRRVDAYESLARGVFGSVTTHVRSDLLRVPYTLLFMECSGAREPERHE